jgi:radical SAM superfamily enzyme YgiQ (UPF0313 family)
MKILLIQPPVQDFYRTPIRTQPIGLAYLAASLQRDGHEAEILDCQREKGRSIPVPSELAYLKDFYPFNDQSPFKLYTGYYHFGMNWDEIRRKIEDSGADVFGISSSFTPYHQEALEIARIIKECDKKRIVVMGGSHVSCDPEIVMRSSYVDYVVLGEGEIRFPLLIKEVKKERGARIDIEGIGYRVNGEIRINPLRTFVQDLDSLPFPARAFLDLDRYRLKKRRSTMVITSRGCPHGCAYCSTHLVMGSSFRKRSPESILQEMVECRNLYGIEMFDIEDDNFTFDKERAKRLMRLIIDAFGEDALELTAMNGVSFASLDGELLKLLRRAGFQTINLSFVSADPLTKEEMKRPRAETGFDQILGEAEAAGLNAIAYAILGMPGQTVQEMVDTIIHLMGKTVLVGPSIYYPTPGTALFEKCREMGILPPLPSQWRSSALPIETEDFNRLDLVTLFRLARVINLIKGKMDQKELPEGITWRELRRVLKEKAKAEGDDAVNWVDLCFLLIDEKSFFSLGKSPDGKTSVVKIPTSKKVFDALFEKVWDKPILKSKNN